MKRNYKYKTAKKKNGKKKVSYKTDIQVQNQEPTLSPVDVVSNNLPLPSGITINYDLQNIKQKHNVTESENIQTNVERKIIYKILLVNGKIVLKEYNKNNEKDSSDHFEESNANCNEIISYANGNNENENECNNTSIIKDGVFGDETQRLTLSILSKTDQILSDMRSNKVDINQHDYCVTVPKSVDHSQYKPKHSSPQNADSKDKILKQLVSISGANLPNKNLYISKKYLDDAKNGISMVLFPIQKYTKLNEKLASCHKEEKPEDETKTKGSKTRSSKKACTTDKELDELRNLKDELSKSFNESQMNMLKNPEKILDMQWSDQDMGKVATLRQKISSSAYGFLKYKMNFPLPPLSAVKKWMIKKNMYIKSEGSDISPEDSKNLVEEDAELNQDFTENILSSPAESIPNLHSDEEDLYNTELQDVESGTVQDFNIMDIKTEDMYDENTLEEKPMSPFPADSGAEYLVFTDDYTEHDESQKQDDTALEETTFHSEETKPIMENVCYLCRLIFKKEEELSEHITEHYRGTNCTSYKDAEKPYVCEFCEEPVKSKRQLVRHHRAHLDVHVLQCYHPGCTYVSSTKDELSQHYYEHYPRALRCKRCPALLDSPQALHRHSRRHATHHANTCVWCLREFRDQRQYRAHVAAHECERTRAERFFVKEELDSPIATEDNAQIQDSKDSNRKRKHQEYNVPTTDSFKRRKQFERRKEKKFVKENFVAEEFLDFNSRDDEDVDLSVTTIANNSRYPEFLENQAENVNLVSDVAPAHTETKKNSAQKNYRTISVMSDNFMNNFTVVQNTNKEKVKLVSNEKQEGINTLSKKHQPKLLKKRRLYEEEVIVTPKTEPEIEYVQNTMLLQKNPREKIIVVPKTKENIDSMQINNQEKIITVPTTNSSTDLVRKCPQQKIIVIPKTDQKVNSMQINNQEEKIIIVPTTNQNHHLVQKNTQQKLKVVPKTNQKLNKNPQETIIIVPTKNRNTNLVQNNSQQKIILVPKSDQNVNLVQSNLPENVVISENYHQRYIIMTDDHELKGVTQEDELLQENEQADGQNDQIISQFSPLKINKITKICKSDPYSTGLTTIHKGNLTKNIVLPTKKKNISLLNSSQTVTLSPKRTENKPAVKTRFIGKSKSKTVMKIPSSHIGYLQENNSDVMQDNMLEENVEQDEYSLLAEDSNTGQDMPYIKDQDTKNIHQEEIVSEAPFDHDYQSDCLPAAPSRNAESVVKTVRVMVGRHTFN